MVIGFDDNRHLALEYRVADCNNPLETRIKYVSVDKEDAYVLAKKVNVALTKLPNYIYKTIISISGVELHRSSNIHNTFNLKL